MSETEAGLRPRLLAIDPSFQGAGLALLNSEEKTIRFGWEKVGASFKKDFNGVLDASMGQVSRILEFIGPRGPHFVITETPPPQGQMAPALYGLDTLLVYRLLELPDVRRIYTVPPHILGHYFERRSVTRSEHRAAGERLAEVFSGRYELIYRKKTLSPDEAVALIFLSRLYVLLSPNSPLSEELLTLFPNLASAKEHLVSCSGFPSGSQAASASAY